MNKIAITTIVLLVLTGIFTFVFYQNQEPEVLPPPETPPSESINDLLPQVDPIAEDSIHLALPTGIYYDACKEIESDTLSVNAVETSTTSSSISSLLDGTVNLALLTPQHIAELYRAKQPIQVICVLPVNDDSDEMLCLAGLSDYLTQHMDTVIVFLSLYEEKMGKILVNWDMMDQVQRNLEEQYALNPDETRTVPDSGFYFIFPT